MMPLTQPTFSVIGEQRNTPIYRAALFIAHLYPAGDLLEGAQTTAAHLIAQHRGAVTDAWAFCRHRISKHPFALSLSKGFA